MLYFPKIIQIFILISLLLTNAFAYCTPDSKGVRYIKTPLVLNGIVSQKVEVGFYSTPNEDWKIEVLQWIDDSHYYVLAKDYYKSPDVGFHSTSVTWEVDDLEFIKLKEGNAYYPISVRIENRDTDEEIDSYSACGNVYWQIPYPQKHGTIKEYIEIDYSADKFYVGEDYNIELDFGIKEFSMKINGEDYDVDDDYEFEVLKIKVSADNELDVDNDGDYKYINQEMDFEDIDRNIENWDFSPEESGTYSFTVKANVDIGGVAYYLEKDFTISILDRPKMSFIAPNVNKELLRGENFLVQWNMDFSQSVNISIQNANAAVVYSTTVSNTGSASVPTSGLASGVYSIVLSSDETGMLVRSFSIYECDGEVYVKSLDAPNKLIVPEWKNTVRGSYLYQLAVRGEHLCGCTATGSTITHKLNGEVTLTHTSDETYLDVGASFFAGNNSITVTPTHNGSCKLNTPLAKSFNVSKVYAPAKLGLTTDCTNPNEMPIDNLNDFNCLITFKNEGEANLSGQIELPDWLVSDNGLSFNLPTGIDQTFELSPNANIKEGVNQGNVIVTSNGGNSEVLVDLTTFLWGELVINQFVNENSEFLVKYSSDCENCSYQWAASGDIVLKESSKGIATLQSLETFGGGTGTIVLLLQRNNFEKHISKNIEVFNIQRQSEFRIENKMITRGNEVVLHFDNPYSLETLITIYDDEKEKIYSFSTEDSIYTINTSNLNAATYSITVENIETNFGNQTFEVIFKPNIANLNPQFEIMDELDDKITPLDKITIGFSLYNPYDFSWDIGALTLQENKLFGNYSCEFNNSLIRSEHQQIVGTCNIILGGLEDDNGFINPEQNIKDLLQEKIQSIDISKIFVLQSQVYSTTINVEWNGKNTKPNIELPNYKNSITDKDVLENEYYWKYGGDRDIHDPTDINLMIFALYVATYGMEYYPDDIVNVLENTYNYFLAMSAGEPSVVLGSNIWAKKYIDLHLAFRQNPQSIQQELNLEKIPCIQFTYLTSSVLRMLNIPVREVNLLLKKNILLSRMFQQHAIAEVLLEPKHHILDPFEGKFSNQSIPDLYTEMTNSAYANKAASIYPGVYFGSSAEAYHSHHFTWTKEGLEFFEKTSLRLPNGWEYFEEQDVSECEYFEKGIDDYFSDVSVSNGNKYRILGLNGLNMFGFCEIKNNDLKLLLPSQFPVENILVERLMVANEVISENEIFKPNDLTDIFDPLIIELPIPTTLELKKSKIQKEDLKECYFVNGTKIGTTKINRYHYPCLIGD